jgi:hypothetical protein
MIVLSLSARPASALRSSVPIRKQNYALVCACVRVCVCAFVRARVRVIYFKKKLEVGLLLGSEREQICAREHSTQGTYGCTARVCAREEGEDVRLRAETRPPLYREHILQRTDSTYFVENTFYIEHIL